MTTFYLIRHAERIGDQQQLVARTEGVRLTPAGEAHAAHLARHLADAPIRQVFSSPLERTRATAAPLAKAKGVAVELSSAIGEIDAGEFTGRTFPDLDANEERWRQFNHFRSGTRLPGGETSLEVQSRFVGEMLRLRATFPDDAIAMFSHADPIKIAVAYFLGTPLDLYDRLEIDLGSVSIVAMHDWGAKILRLNESPRATPA
jgi:broad specificity phosphatase PhoE